MGELTNQVIEQWAQLSPPAPTPPPPLSTDSLVNWQAVEPDIKTSFLKIAIKSDLLSPSHSVSIAPISYKVEADPLVFFDQMTGFTPGTKWEEAARTYQAFFQSIEIKQLFKLAFKGEKEVAFKTKGSIEYSANDDDEYKKTISVLVGIIVALSAIAAIAAEILGAYNKTKDIKKWVWIGHLALSRIVFCVFNFYIRTKILIEAVQAVQGAGHHGQENEGVVNNGNQAAGIAAAAIALGEDAILPARQVLGDGPPQENGRVDPLSEHVQVRRDSAVEHDALQPMPDRLQQPIDEPLALIAQNAENAIHEVRGQAAEAANAEEIGLSDTFMAS